MTDCQPLTQAEEALWRAFARVTVSLPRALDEDLSREAGMSLTEYGVLMHLSEAPCRQLRMTGLAAATGLSASRITRLVDGLQKRGLVTRSRCEGDARGYVTALTEAGLSRLRAAYPSHLASIRGRVIDRLDPAVVPALSGALQAIAAGLR